MKVANIRSRITTWTWIFSLPNQYLFNEDIDILQVAQRVGPPREGRTREIPQWVDFFGKLDEQRWADILGAVCFAFNTRGVMSVKGMCDAIAPILDVFEAQLIVSWGLETGVFARATHRSNITLGEWWWLVAQRLWNWSAWYTASAIAMKSRNLQTFSRVVQPSYVTQRL